MQAGASAQTEVEIGRIPIGNNFRIARNTEVVVAEIGKERWLAVSLFFGRMAGSAIAFGGVVKEREPSGFLRGEFGLAGEYRIVFA